MRGLVVLTTRVPDRVEGPPGEVELLMAHHPEVLVAHPNARPAHAVARSPPSISFLSDTTCSRRSRRLSSGEDPITKGEADEDLPNLGPGGRPGEGAALLHRRPRVREEDRHPPWRGPLAHRR